MGNAVILKRVAVIAASAVMLSSTFTACKPKNVSGKQNASSLESESSNSSSEPAAVSSQAASTINFNSALAKTNSTNVKKAYSMPSYSASKTVFAKNANQKETKISLNNKHIVAPSIPKGAAGNSVVKITQIEGVDGSFYDPVINEKVSDMGKKTFILGTFWPEEWNGKGTTADNKRTTQALQQIEKDYNCTVKVQAMPGNYLAKVTSAKSSGTVYADIYECQTEMNDLFRSGDFQDLLSVKSVNAFKSQWNPVYTLCSSFKGADYGVGLRYDHVEHNIMLFNTDLVKKYNLGDLYGYANSGKWTDDLFLQVSQAFKKENADKTIYTCDGLYPQEILALVYTNWTSPFGVTSSRYIFNGQDSTVLDILTFLQNYVKQGLYNSSTPKNDWQRDGTYKWVAGGDAASSQASFKTGKTLFYVGSDTLLPDFSQSSKAHYGILPLPKGPAADTYSTVIRNVKYFSLSAQDPNLENAGTILVALANRTNIKTSDVVQYNSSLVQDPRSTAQLTENYKYKQILNIELNASTLLPQIYYGAALNCILKQNATPKQAMDSIAAKAQTEINTVFGQK